MCGRYTQLFSWKEIWAFSQPFRGPSVEPRKRYNVPPQSEVPVIRADEEGPLVEYMQWWLIPHWSKSREPKYSTFNAKSEEAPEKPAFRTPFKRRRCVIPASGFYEWKKTGSGGKQPYYITRKDGDVIFFAGLWDEWQEELHSCTILTTEPNAELSKLHHRMPCILERDALSGWIDPSLAVKSEIQGFLTVPEDDLLDANPVSKAVGSPRNDSPELIEPLEN